MLRFNKNKFLSGLFAIGLWYLPYASMAAPLNDTGITRYGDAASNSLTAEPAGYPRQDAGIGRDAAAADGMLSKIGGGSAGFDFTALNANGHPTAPGTGTTPHPCVRDNVTGLTWEVKTNDGGLRSQNWTYTWYNSNPASNGGSAGTASGGSCLTAGRCDTEKYVQDVNAAGLCGHTDWRMPAVKELESIVDYSRVYPNPTIDTTYFPNTIASYFWSASAYAYYSGSAWYVHFGYGYAGYGSKSLAFRVRLVRGGQ